METFLRKFAKQIAADYYNPQNLCIVLPTKRAVTFLKRELASAYNTTFWAPEFFSLGEFVEEQSAYRKEDKLILILELYESYLKVVKGTPEDLSAFLKWAPNLLSDFAEIDRYLIDPKNIFSYINEARALEYWNVNGEPLTDAQRKYLHFWQLLGDIYHQYHKDLTAKGIAYPGIQFREVAQKIKTIAPQLTYEKIIFAGFNALSASEEKIIYTLVKQGYAKIYWDGDDYYTKHPEQEAGRFMRRIIKKFPTVPFLWSENNLATTPKNINVVACNTDSAQADYTSKVLSQHYNSENAVQTAVVLNDEQLLMPVLYNLPSEVKHANITMGYGLSNVPLHSFINAFLDCWGNYRGNEDNKAFYFKNIFQLLDHPYFSFISGKGHAEKDFKDDLVKKNVIYVGQKRFVKFFKKQDFIDLLFNQSNVATENIALLLQVLGIVKTGVAESKTVSDLEKSLHIEYVYHYTLVLRKFARITKNSVHFQSIPVKTLKKLLHQLVGSESLSFFGEPLKGLQIMGTLETRLLDFERIIVLSTNEGVLPQGKKDMSFIPYDIKREFNLPTHHDHDAVFANHFYRLLQRAKNIDLVYVTGSNDFGAATEKSRFIEQLEFELPKINTQAVINKLSYAPSPNFKEFEVTHVLDEQIEAKILHQLQKGISPSAFNKYIACPLDFYYRYVLGLGEADEVEETLKHSTFGTCVHHALEELFKPFERKNILIQDIDKMFPKVEKLLTDKFRESLDLDDLKSGNNRLVFEVANQYVNNFLKLEKENIATAQTNKHDYRVLEQEQEMFYSLMANINGKEIPVKIKGFADRIGVLNNTIQLIDYKTGNVTSTDLGVKTWDVLAETPAKSKALQLALYGFIYLMNNPSVNEFSAGIYSFRNLKAGLLPLKVGNKPITANDLRENMPNVIQQIVTNMLSVENQFKHNPNSKYCNYCEN